MKKPIVTDTKFLRQKSLPIETLDEAKTILQDLEDSLDTTKGCGLSAPQIGILKRISIVKLNNTTIVLLNPTIVGKNNPVRINGEGCLSVPGLRITTRRYANIAFEHYDLETGELKTSMSMGIEAVAIQHEIDHLNGILLLDRKWKAR